MTKIKQKNDPSLSPFSSFHIEIDKFLGFFTFSCSGVKGISDFSDNEIKIRLPGFSVLLKGDKLCMTVLENGCVEITGKISEVKFIYGKN